MQEHVIAKKYAKALAGVCSSEDIVGVYNIYANISQAFSIERFKTIVNSRIVTNDEKFALLQSLTDMEDNRYAKRLLSILVCNDRISLIPFVAFELKKVIDYRLNVYQGTLYAKQTLDTTELRSIQEKLGKKLNVMLEVKQKIDPDLDGIKLEVSDLGIEVAFLKHKFTQELQDFILKAI